MPKFTTDRIFKLAFLGKEWEECFIKFNSVSIKESKELVNQKIGSKTPAEIIDITTNFLKSHFVDGNAYDSETSQIIKLKVEELEELPSLIQEKAILFLVGDSSQ